MVNENNLIVFALAAVICAVGAVALFISAITARPGRGAGAKFIGFILLAAAAVILWMLMSTSGVVQ